MSVINEAELTRRCPTCGRSNDRVTHRSGAWVLVECEECGLLYVANPPNDAQLRELYDADSYHSAAAVGNDESLDHRAVAHVAHLERLHPARGRVLDVGCSTGQFLRAARAVGWSVAGAELSARSADVARRVYGLDVVTGTLADSPWESGAFDAVTLWDVIEHVAEPAELLDRAHALLAPGGLLIMATPAVDGLYPSVSRRLRRITRWWGHPEPPYHLQQYSRSTITDACRRHGFEVTEITTARIPLGYSFGLTRSIRRNIASVLFLPLAAVGPWIGRGDTMVVVARRPDRPPAHTTADVLIARHH